MNLELTNKIKKSIFYQLEPIQEDVGLLLSSGVDSRVLLFSLLSLGKKVHVYSFRLDGVYSTDFVIAQDLAKQYGLEFTEIVLPNDIDVLKRDVLYLINDLKLCKKADIECSWAMMYAFKSINENVVVSGLGADDHFVLTKKGMIHYRDSVESMDKYRTMIFSNPNHSQKQTANLLCKNFNKALIAPFLNDDMFDIFKGTSWEELNKPHQKQVLLDIFPNEFAKTKLPKHSNLQLGDSGIAKHFTKLLDTDWKVGKSVVSIYNTIKNGKIIT